LAAGEWKSGRADSGNPAFSKTIRDREVRIYERRSKRECARRKFAGSGGDLDISG
jgi:hypothetical protein